MRSLKAQLMGMVSGKSEKPSDSTILPDSATFVKNENNLLLVIDDTLSLDL